MSLPLGQNHLANSTVVEAHVYRGASILENTLVEEQIIVDKTFKKKVDEIIVDKTFNEKVDNKPDTNKKQVEKEAEKINKLVEKERVEEKQNEKPKNTESSETKCKYFRKGV